MTSRILFALAFAASASAWIYSKLQRYNGGNTQSSLTGAATVAALIFLVVLTLANVLF